MHEQKDTPQNENFQEIPKTKGLRYEVKLLNESCHGNDISGVDLEELGEFTSNTGLQDRESIEIPSHSEPEIIRHFVRLSTQNYSIDSGFYPLGSCTMKYNPRINEKVARYPGFSSIHPLQLESSVSGAIELMYQLQSWLAELSGLPAVSLLPAAGAHGEYTGIRVIKQAHLKKENHPREYVIIPDSAHGTNPATAALCGYKILTIKTNEEGVCTLESIKELINKHGNKIAALMITNPNTCGKFEKHISDIAKEIHQVGAYIYCDGANFNAIVGNIQPSDFGIDVMHFNLHKTFSTPHGGGGPGCGPIAVSEELSPYLPTPYAIKNESGEFRFQNSHPDSIGKIKGFHGQFTLMVRALSYMMSLGKDGLSLVSKDAVLSANYILSKLSKYYHVPYKGRCMHECLLTDKLQKSNGVTTLDIAKALIEKGMHPMTVYFPLTVQGAMLIEPTETETKETIDEFIEAMIEIAKEVESGNGEKYHNYPLSTPRTRLDEVAAARNPILTWKEI